MAEFLKDTQLVAAIEEMIENADKYLWIISPYIKLHERIKSLLKSVTTYKPDVEIAVVFGKNEEDLHKSISKEDLAFLKDLPNIYIGYEKRLHAKFYASEDFAIITSMNLHQFSHNNNIEAGIKLKSNKWLGGDNNSEGEAINYFADVLDNSNEIFVKEAVYKSGLFGITQSYSHSEVKVDNTETFFKQPDFVFKKVYKKPVQSFKPQTEPQGFCIRTGKPIPFNPQRPMCRDAFDSWNKFKNPDYAEKFCHKTGKPSGGKTSMRNPCLT